MSPSHLRAAVAAALFSLYAQVALGQAEGQGLKLQRSLGDAPAGDELPTFVIADRIEGVTEVEIEASGNAEIRKGSTLLYGDRIRYFQDSDEAEATGNVKLLVQGDQVTGPRLRMRLGDTTGIFDEPVFNLAPREFKGGGGGMAGPTLTLVEQPEQPKVESRGDARALRFDGQDEYRISDGRFTTCKPGQDDWFINAEELDIDMGREVGTARNASVSFLGVTTPSIPWFNFSLNNQRKSGFLPPTFALSGKNGPEFTLPFYWNIAPNYDAIIAGHYMGKRGMQLQTEGRYLQPYNYGTVRYETLPKDHVLGEERHAYAWQHTAAYANGWSGLINVNGVSDDNYFRDLSGRLAVATQTYLPREGSVTYASSSGWWSTTGRVQRFQTLQDPLNPVGIPYERVPQVTLAALNQDLNYLDLGLLGEFVSFDHPTAVLGRRTIAYPSIAVPIQRPGGYFTPKIGLHATWYDLSNIPDPTTTPSTQSRFVPIASIDTGLFFERDARWFDNDFVQTLEPRLYYLNVPYRNQDAIPVFDTGLADFNFSQIFSENTYVGGDRISNANQLTAAVTSRLISPTNGQEVIRVLLGQRYYYEDQRVGLPGVTPRTASFSPILAGLAGRVAPNWTAETTVQYGFSENQLERLNAGVRYSPAPASVASVAYRYTNANQTTTGAINTIDVAAQWPLGGGFYGVGRYNYDLNGGKAVESLIGLEYNADCWILRGVVHQFQTATQQETSVFYIQLELNGFSRIGSNPLEVLRRNIPGYTRTNLIDPSGGGNAFGSNSAYGY